jgi:hypothetical protein
VAHARHAHAARGRPAGIYGGITTIEEVVRETLSEEIG